MSKYTIEIRKIINLLSREEVESWFKDYELSDYLTSAQIDVINKNGLWNKDKLAKKIVDHYYMHEIGFETIALFKHYAKTTMQEIMEEKLPIIYSSAIEYDPLINVDFTETFEREIEGESNYGSNSSLQSSINNQGSSSSNSQANSESLNINNQTPQTNITKQDLNEGFYAKSVGQDESSQNAQSQTSTNDTQTSNSSQNAESSQDSTSKEKYTRTQKGNSGALTTTQALIQQYRKTVIAIDREIIEELNSLFFGLF